MPFGLIPNARRHRLLGECWEARDRYLAQDGFDPQVASYATQALLSESLGERVQDMPSSERVPLERMLHGLALYRGHPRLVTLIRALIAQPRYVAAGSIRGLRVV